MWSWLAFGQRPFQPALGQGGARIAQFVPVGWCLSHHAEDPQKSGRHPAVVRLLQRVYPPFAPLDLRMLVPAGPGTSRRTPLRALTDPCSSTDAAYSKRSQDTISINVRHHMRALRRVSENNEQDHSRLPGPQPVCVRAARQLYHRRPITPPGKRDQRQTWRPCSPLNPGALVSRKLSRRLLPCPPLSSSRTLISRWHQ
jgi:hypothetical protein